MKRGFTLAALLLATLLIATLLVATNNASAEPVINVVRDDMGGLIGTYEAKYASWAQRGDHIIIDGDCASACTTLVGILSPGHVCVTPRARFGLHLGRYSMLKWQGRDVYVDASPDIQARFNEKYYNEPHMKKWLEAHGPLTTEPQWMTFEELSEIYQKCPGY
jgi:hypothetical protein